MAPVPHRWNPAKSVDFESTRSGASFFSTSLLARARLEAWCMKKHLESKQKLNVWKFSIFLFIFKFHFSLIILSPHCSLLNFVRVSGYFDAVLHIVRTLFSPSYFNSKIYLSSRRRINWKKVFMCALCHDGMLYTRNTRSLNADYIVCAVRFRFSHISFASLCAARFYFRASISDSSLVYMYVLLWKHSRPFCALVFSVWPVSSTEEIVAVNTQYKCLNINLPSTFQFIAHFGRVVTGAAPSTKCLIDKLVEFPKWSGRGYF